MTIYRCFCKTQFLLAFRTGCTLMTIHILTVLFIDKHINREDVQSSHSSAMIIWFRPLEVSLGELSVQWCCGSAQPCRTDGQMWTDWLTDPWLIVHLSAPPADSLGRSTVLCCSSICLSLISHAFALSFQHHVFFSSLYKSCVYILYLM